MAKSYIIAKFERLIVEFIWFKVKKFIQCGVVEFVVLIIKFIKFKVVEFAIKIIKIKFVAFVVFIKFKVVGLVASGNVEFVGVKTIQIRCALS